MHVCVCVVCCVLCVVCVCVCVCVCMFMYVLIISAIALGDYMCLLHTEPDIQPARLSFGRRW